jgi:hypothetical protein
VRDTDASAAVAEERNGHLSGLAHLGGKRRAKRVANARANDGVHAKDALGDVGDVHRATLAPVGTGDLAKQLSHHRHDVHPLGDAVTVTAVIGGNPVIIFECGADTGRDRFLADAVMHSTDGHAGLDEPLQPLLELADERHALIHPEELFRRECRFQDDEDIWSFIDLIAMRIMDLPFVYSLQEAVLLQNIGDRLDDLEFCARPLRDFQQSSSAIREI